MDTVISIVILLLPYLLGSTSAAVWVSRGLYGVDIRTLGSNNAGSTNMFRELGFKAGAITQVADISKGALAAALPYFVLWTFPEVRHVLVDLPLEAQSLVCGMLAVIGHIYPVFAGFRGGKGINTLLGMMLVTNPLACLVCVLSWVLVLYITRYVAIASMLGVLTYPMYLVIRHLVDATPFNWPLIGLGLGMFALVVFTHRSNIVRLREGTEGKNPWFEGRVQ